MPRKKQPHSQSGEDNQGEAILTALNTILNRCEAVGARLGYPGEGGERSFRAWLVSDLLTTVLGWPVDKVVVGERFDILMQDADGFPVATIETKTPYHKASPQERSDFESRLSGFGTLRTALFTNGANWERLDIFAPTGELEIRERFEFDLQNATPEEAEAFFAPLVAGRHLRGAHRATRHPVSRDNPHILESLAADLDQAIADLAVFFEQLFDGLRSGKAGDPARGVALNLFELWCDKSLVVSPRQAGENLAAQFRKPEGATQGVEKLVSAVGFVGNAAALAVDAVASLSKSRRTDASAVAESLWPAYYETIQKLCAQTAHVVIARALLYRIGEDKQTFPRVLSGERMEESLAAVPVGIVDASGPATELLLRVQVSMQDVLPVLYKLGEFDWWLVPSEKRASLPRAERAWLRQTDTEFERAAQRLLRMLNAYYFGRVDVDVWRNVYQQYLPADERQRLGGFYTPDELVDLVLDLAQFTAESPGLCTLSFIDQACGSGAFAANALSRLLQHLELKLPCHAELHKRGTAEWKRAEAILNIVARNLHAVDLHPFASFLTTINVLFLLMPLYVKAREKNPLFSLDLQVFSSDSLEKHDHDLVEPDLFARLNSRVQLTEDSFRRYQGMLAARFDRVFGNPPWGGVLKGPLAPVYDVVKKRRFGSEYLAAARGKYDVYGLFIERALQILKPGGRLALLTQGSFIDKQWASGLRELLATQARLLYIVDLNPFGQLFFDAMNTPCITVADALPGSDDNECIAVLSSPPVDLGNLDEAQRRAHVVATVRRALEEVAGPRRTAGVQFAHAARISGKRLRETASDRWDLSGAQLAKRQPQGWMTGAELLEMRQGVTPGGSLDIYLMSGATAKQLGLEEALLRQAVKSKEVERWYVAWQGLVLLYPYAVVGSKALPAFSLDLAGMTDEVLASMLSAAYGRNQSGLWGR